MRKEHFDKLYIKIFDKKINNIHIFHIDCREVCFMLP